METLSGIFIEPILGEPSKAEDSSESPALSKQFGDKSLLVQILLLLFFVTTIGLLISLLIFCKKYVYNKCCSFGQKLINFIKNKLMYNSVLRALMQTFLMTNI